MTGRSASGQVLVIVAVLLVILLGAAAFTVDLGRHAAQERYLQNAADAGALAGCRMLTDGATDEAARNEADRVARINLAGSPAGTDASLQATTDPLVYESGHAGDPLYLTSGILLSSTTIRVAIASDIPTTFGAVLGLPTLTARGRAKCALEGGPTMPIVARRYQNPFGPGSGFIDHVATEATSTSGKADPNDPLGYDGGTRTPASEASPGPEFEVYGPGSKAQNDSAFRGFIALDIRNFATATSRVYFNGVTPGTNANTIKTMQGAYIKTGYPGPRLPPVVTPPDPNDQVAVIRGNDTAMIMDNFDDAFVVGDRLQLPVYNTTVMEIPDFSITPPARITLPSTTSVPTNGPSFSLSRNKSFLTTVTLHLHGDVAAATATPPRPEYNILPVPEAGNFPPPTGKMNEPIFLPNVLVPDENGTTVAMKDISTNAVPVGIYTVWLEGHSGSPYFLTRRSPVPVRIGGATRTFSLDNSIAQASTTQGGTATLDIKVSTASGGSEAWGSTNAVALSWDTGSFTTCTLSGATPPSQITFSATSVVPSSTGGGATSTLSVNSTGLSTGCYQFNVRATGTNGDNQPVTRLLPVQILVATEAGGGAYVDIIGFAVFKVTAVDANGFSARAVSRLYADSNDPALRRAQRPRLVPWS